MKTKSSRRLWLTLKLIRHQKLRTAAIFCGMLFSVFLLDAFAGFGYDFWIQVHGGTGEAAEYDRTQLILIALLTVLLLLVTACSGILLHNLYALTSVQRQRSLIRLSALGASTRDILVMTLQENLIFFCISVPTGCVLTRLSNTIAGIQARPPLWITGSVLLWIWVVSCLCSVRPLRVSRNRKPRKTNILQKDREKTGSVCFQRYMIRTYRQANRSFHVRVVLTILSAILLYLPTSYLIETNLAVQRAGLDAKHGIQYDCSPKTTVELTEAIRECRQLADSSSAIYVSMPASASVKTDDLSKELRKLLHSAGWREQENFSADSTLYFLEDPAYTGFLESNGLSPAASAVMIDSYINRRSWKADAAPSHREVPFLDTPDHCSDVVVLHESVAFSPEAVTGEIPEGLTPAGDLSLILPMSRLNDFLSSSECQNLSVCGRFCDPDESAFLRLQEALGESSIGSLRYTRKILQEWYSSMRSIHRAMTAICALLFFIAVLNMFSMMLFQYMEQKRGLAILWSLGQSPGELLKILTGQHLWNLLAGISLGIPISGLLCYYIYRIFRQVWNVGFVFPLGQTALMAAAACVLSVFAILTEGMLMRRQDFLGDIREIV